MMHEYKLLWSTLCKRSRFLPSITKFKDGHFINPIHLLEYYDLLKIPGYDSYCPSLNKTTYLHLCCSECNKYFPTLTFLINHKQIVHPTSCGRPKGKGKDQNSSTLDNFSVLPSQRQDKILLFEEMRLRECISDHE